MLLDKYNGVSIFLTNIFEQYLYDISIIAFVNYKDFLFEISNTTYMISRNIAKQLSILHYMRSPHLTL